MFARTANFFSVLFVKLEKNMIFFWEKASKELKILPWNVQFLIVFPQSNPKKLPPEFLKYTALYFKLFNLTEFKV